MQLLSFADIKDDRMINILKGKRGLIMGVANDHSIAWGIAKVLHSAGAQLAFSYQGESIGKRLKPLALTVDSDFMIPCNVEDPSSMDLLFERIKERWETLDFVVHSIAFSDKNELRGPYYNTSRDNFIQTMLVSCFSFTEIVRRAAQLMPHGGAMITLTYGGSMRVVPNYNAMAPAKSALESSTKYLACDYGGMNIRINAISAGPVRTLAGASISNGRDIAAWSKENSPLKRTVSLEDIGNSALYLLSYLSNGVTGEIHYVDCGYNIVAMPSYNKNKVIEN
ncbi:Enoyl-[acyl-carrier-protein] reductase [NADH] FabI [Candidatus Liberibacter asiaticus]|nr:Enoyl-[acyl-carrier-protein] reductase [NADH] FabI [Candidatus Liberibacter asiaticus]KAE9511086.1 Enoyl-[acyl-carrier-protein] reductase [NADH] FabI [Candidatus Liberibacter asiaticus]KAE9512459.1 Enoyl-[acyl-carrier-protein] reductase [NADH] FabI [Candidatus Liberibacter asiaticus]KAE9514661.1 Enoyl-[acyl-carrier-protein] reductase [NADH] FabI [Candidatus Liberibacter asiaticus]KAE9516705.1 Enoyl-[acyl-carrier-protein] reductase [NADH] FabI [Candidatus Liberibacter asiaticus]